MARNLLTVSDVCFKFKKSRTWFDKNRARLLDKGFPAPIEALGGDRYDEYAIDLWLDSLLPTGYKKEQAEPHEEFEANKRISARIAGISHFNA